MTDSEELDHGQGTTAEGLQVAPPLLSPCHHQEQQCYKNDDFVKSLHIAPMLDVSNREFRQLFRILSKRCVLWTEMVVDETLVYTDNIDEHLAYDNDIDDDKSTDKEDNESKNRTKRSSMHPIICQIGGNRPEFSGRAAALVEQYGYDEVNLNCECPSNRVSGKREFGGALMKNINVAVAMVEAMQTHITTGTSKSTMAVSVKTRIGVDELDDLDFLVEFIGRLSAVCHKFVIHARKVLLNGLSPAQNRIIPPLNYPRVYELCRRFPDCEFIINGGIPGLLAAKQICYGTTTSGESTTNRLQSSDVVHCNKDEEHVVPCKLCNISNGSCTAPPQEGMVPPNLKGCMLGRAAMDNPSMFWDVDRYFYGEETNPCQNRREVLNKYIAFLEKTYPRRCCDNDERITKRIPAPKVTMERQFCHVCQDVYGGGDNGSSKLKQQATSTATTTQTTTQTTGTITSSADIKITSRVIDRSLKPILGMFFNLKGSKRFRRVCDDLSRDLTIRNCGPGYILRIAMKSMSCEILDQTFVKTEDLQGVTIHVSPTVDCSRRRKHT